MREVLHLAHNVDDFGLALELPLSLLVEAGARLVMDQENLVPLVQDPVVCLGRTAG